MTVDEEVFFQQILEDRDRLYRETSRLKSQLSSFENFGTERDTYQKQITEKDRTIILHTPISKQQKPFSPKSYRMPLSIRIAAFPNPE